MRSKPNFEEVVVLLYEEMESTELLVRLERQTNLDEMKEARQRHLAAGEAIREGMVDVALPQRPIVVPEVVGEGSRVELRWPGSRNAISEGRETSPSRETHRGRERGPMR